MAGEVKKLRKSNSIRDALRTSLKRSESLKVKDMEISKWGVSGVARSITDDFAHLCMEMQWGQLLFFILAVYAGWSFLFAAVLYRLDGAAGIKGDVPSEMTEFEACFWFSVVNTVTAGFGAMVPGDRQTYIISSAAHFVGLILNALLLGIMVAKASLPTAKMVFSDVICVRNRNGVQHLVIRLGNARGNVLYSPDIRLAYIRLVTTDEGETFYQDTQLSVKLPVALQPVFTIIHPVTRDSHLYGLTEMDIVNENGFFIMIVSATDVETGQTIYTRHMYFPKDFRWNHTFEDVVSVGEHARMKDGRSMEEKLAQLKQIDFLKFHRTVPLSPEGSKKVEHIKRFGALPGGDGSTVILRNTGGFSTKDDALVSEDSQADTSGIEVMVGAVASKD